MQLSSNVAKNVKAFLNQRSSSPKTNLIDVCTGTDYYSDSDNNNSNNNIGTNSHSSRMLLKIKSNHKFTMQNKLQQNLKGKLGSPKRTVVAQHKQSNSMNLPICNSIKAYSNQRKEITQHNQHYSFQVFRYNNKNDSLNKMFKQQSYSVSKEKIGGNTVKKANAVSRNELGIYKRKRNALTFSIVDIPFEGKNAGYIGMVKERMFCGKYLKAPHKKERHVINLKLKNVNRIHEVGKCLGNEMKNTKSLPQIKFKLESGIEIN